MPVRDKLESPRGLAIAQYIGLLLALLPGAIGVLTAISERNWATAIPLLEACFFLSLLVIYVFPNREHTETISTEIFRPFEPLASDLRWPRPEPLKAVTEMILDHNSDRVPVLIGASGSGKSSLVKLVRENTIQSAPPESFRIVESYTTNLPYEIQCLRAECPKDFDLTLVLDQFEQWLGGIRQLKRQARRQAQEDFRDVIRSRHKQKLRVTIVIRKEWLSELRFLGELVPPLANLVEITGPPVDDTEDATLEALANRLSTACAIELAEAHEIIRRLDVDGRFLPLEAQLVGATLERERRMSRNISTQDFDERLHGVGGCIENYFETLLASSNDRRVTTKVLCSLSARTRFRQKEDYSDILRAVYEEKSAVDRAVEELRAAHVVVSRGIDHIELAHDYLAEFFYAKSGTELNPIERDNIFYHLESARQDQPSILVDEVRGEALPRPIGRYVVTTLLTIMVVRFINLGLPWIRFGPDLTRPLFGNMFDVAYLPILIAQGIWIAYAGRFHDAVFRFVKEDALARATSRFVVYNLVLSIAVGLFSFYAWWLGIVTGGLVLALKILLLSRRRDLSFAAVDRLRNFGFITLFNMVFLGILAVSYLVVGPAFAAERTGQDATIVASTIASLMLTYGCIALASAHVTKAGVSQLLGLIGRPKRAPIPRPDVS